jgi:hypothetical protein
MNLAYGAQRLVNAFVIGLELELNPLSVLVFVAPPTVRICHPLKSVSDVTIREA